MCFEEWTAFPAQHVRYGERGKAAKRARARALEGGGSSPWNFNQRQLLAGVARSPYVRIFLLETQRQNSIFPPFSPLNLSPFSLCLSRPGCDNVVVAIATRGGNRQVLLRDARRLILVFNAFRFS